jgi:CRP-like cAMP-binding protein
MEYHKNSNIFIRDFIFKNSPALVYPSFFLNEPSRYSIRALTDCTVWELSKKNFEIGKKEIPNLQIIAFKITNLFHQNIEKRFESLITKTPEERYVDLVKSHNEIINSVQLKEIASYLGINAVTLSRIRSRIAKRGYN